jgi:hypothetical protein
MGLVRLTYEELGERLGMSPHAARMRARRRRWPIAKGNDGKARVSVDEAELVAEGERVHERAPERSPERAEHEAVQLSGLQATVLALTERAAKAEGENAVLRHLIDEFRAALERERARGDRLEAEARRPWWRRLIG